MSVKYMADFTADDMAEIDRITHIEPEERTDEENAIIEEWENAQDIAQHEFEALEAQARATITTRINELAQQHELARNTFEAMYNAALARLEAANNG